jgi:hypothetical protein
MFAGEDERTFSEKKWLDDEMKLSNEMKDRLNVTMLKPDTCDQKHVNMEGKTEMETEVERLTKFDGQRTFLDEENVVESVETNIKPSVELLQTLETSCSQSVYPGSSD